MFQTYTYDIKIPITWILMTESATSGLNRGSIVLKSPTKQRVCVNLWRDKINLLDEVCKYNENA